MKITRKNYESYFIDYLEGNLPPADQQEFQAFLLLNEDLAELLEDMEMVHLKRTKVTYPHKAQLKKDILHACPDYYAIAIAEDAVLPEDLPTLRRLEETKNLEGLVTTYRTLKLKPDLQLRFLYKKRLYQKLPLSKWMWIGGAAALLFLFVGIKSLLPPQQIDYQVSRTLPALYIPSSSISLQASSIPPADLTLPLIKRSSPLKTKNEASPVLAGTSWTCTATYTGTPILEQAVSRISSQTMPEIELSEEAIRWKASYPSFLSQNIFTSVYQMGKNLAFKLRNPIKAYKNASSQ